MSFNLTAMVMLHLQAVSEHCAIKRRASGSQAQASLFGHQNSVTPISCAGWNCTGHSCVSESQIPVT